MHSIAVLFLQVLQCFLAGVSNEVQFEAHAVEVLLLSLHVFAWKQEAEDIILSMDPIMLPDPLLEPMDGADEDAVCDFVASKLDLIFHV